MSSDKEVRQTRFDFLSAQNRLDAGASQIREIVEGGIAWTVFTPTNTPKYSGEPIAVPSDCDAYKMIEERFGNIGSHPSMSTVLEKYRQVTASS